ncbi:hypothetical protein RND81_12G049600 [Saponaria officinalis]|uniref:BED-type domain-containing protein n=1 Tax=Saponaria officinalis TaxID=3572 RepID=A0AAW1H7A0_SAPOF
MSNGNVEVIMPTPLLPNTPLPDSSLIQLDLFLRRFLVKKRRREADIWKHFKFYKCISKTEPEKMYAVCIYCRKAFYRAESKCGTSNPIRHIAVCIDKKKQPCEETKISKVFDQNVYVELMAEAIMMHGYPFSIVEHRGLRRVHLYLNENVKPISRNSIKKVCLLKHGVFKEKIKEILGALTSRICLTCDVWTACTSRAYLTLTAHYVDDKWILRSKVLNFVHFPPPHTGFRIFSLLLPLIQGWGIEKKTFTLTLDNASNNDSMVADMRNALMENLPRGGDYFHIRCCAHILNLVVKDGLKVIDECVIKVREIVKYIDASEGRIIKFYHCANRCSLATTTKLWMDVATRWNSTYLMLKKAIFYKKALDMYALDESGFRHRISSSEWLKVEKICSLLEPFYEITNAFSGSEYPTANLYFINIWKIQRLLISAIDGGDTNIAEMASKMYEKFDKYWHEFSLILSFAVILDPRYKYDFVLYSLKKLHGDLTGTNKANVIYVQFLELYKDYEKNVSHIPTVSANNDDIGCGDLEDFDACYGSSKRSGSTEYERYLLDDKELRTVPIDVLTFWSKNVDKYPILSSMAKDILAIPITTVASESTFSMGGRILNKWRSSLLSQNVEALVTTRNWLFGYEGKDNKSRPPEMGR